MDTNIANIVCRQTSAVEEEAGVVKSGSINVAFAPFRSKKSYYAVLGERALELHENEKAQRKKRHPKYLFDLSTCFNVHRHFEGKMKYHVSLMTPDETILLKTDMDCLTDEWYDSLLSVLITSRALHLGRPVLSSEFFECAWDVSLVGEQKTKKILSGPDKLPNMSKKNPSLIGAQRLCFYPHTIIICKKGIEPASLKDLPSSGIPPFCSCDFVEIPRKFVANFGCQEKFFMMRIGRSSPTGSAELWAQCDSEETAAEIHNRLNKIIERESEKKKQIVNGSLLQGNSIRNSSITFPRNRQASCSITCNQAVFRDQRAKTRTAVDFQKRDQSAKYFASDSSRKTSAPNKSMEGDLMMVDRSHSMSARFPTSFRDDRHSKRRSDDQISLNLLKRINLEHEQEATMTSSLAEETEDSGGTLRLSEINEQEVVMKKERDSEMACTIQRMLPQELKDRCSPWLELFIREPYKGSADGAAECLQSEFEEHHDDLSSAACSMSTNDEFVSMTPGDVSITTSTDNLEHAQMEMHSSAGFDYHYNLEEVRSYVSDSSDSCYSSLAANAPRAYSFGSHIASYHNRLRKHRRRDQCSQNQESSVNAHQETNANTTSARSNSSVGGNAIAGEHDVKCQVDPRKRAYSLGSKSWFQKPFRKFSRDLIWRSHQHSNMPTTQLVSSNATTSYHQSKISTQPIQAYIAPDPSPILRGRSYSGGSNRSAPHIRRVNPDNDHIQVDFGVMVPSASGSIHSFDAENRSRTSSFGCSQRHKVTYDPGDVVVHNVAMGSSPHSLAGYCLEAKENVEEYVASDPLTDDFNDQSSVCSTSGQENSLNCVNFADCRLSKGFETIEESTSGRSSLSSSREDCDMFHIETNNKILENCFAKISLTRSQSETKRDEGSLEQQSHRKDQDCLRNAESNASPPEKQFDRTLNKNKSYFCTMKEDKNEIDYIDAIWDCRQSVSNTVTTSENQRSNDLSKFIKIDPIIGTTRDLSPVEVDTIKNKGDIDRCMIESPDSTKDTANGMIYNETSVNSADSIGLRC